MLNIPVLIESQRTSYSNFVLHSSASVNRGVSTKFSLAVLATEDKAKTWRELLFLLPWCREMKADLVHSSLVERHRAAALF